MADQRAGNQPTKQNEYSGQQPKPLNDLDSPPDEAEKVKGGGRPRGDEDPCAGGE